MNFKPVDELSLRHLFSSPFAEEMLQISYLGPVLNSAGSIESSPDCIVLDRRRHPFKQLRCEFKFIPPGAQEFARNGRFDIAIVWSLTSGISKDHLLADLLRQNGCAEIIVMADLKPFHDLPVYTSDALSKLDGVEKIKKLALKREYESVFALCIAARLYPNKFEMSRMVDLLSSRFPRIQKMQPRGRANVVAAFMQTTPPLLELMHGQFYRWTSAIDSINGSAELTQLIEKNFFEDPPTDEHLKAVRA